MNGNTNAIYSNTLYDPGRYFLHLNHYFVEFTKTRRSIVFSDSFPLQRKIKDPSSTVTGSIVARTK